MTSFYGFGANALSAKDACRDAVVELSKGIARSYKVYDKKQAKILQVGLSFEDEIRHYSVDVEHDGSIDSYLIELENDSAYKCLLKQIVPTQIGG